MKFKNSQRHVKYNPGFFLIFNEHKSCMKGSKHIFPVLSSLWTGSKNLHIQALVGGQQSE